MPQVTKVIVKHYGVLAESEKGWTKELNLVSWNSRDPRLDIREWAPDKNKTGKGVTIKQSEFGALKRIVNTIDMLSDIEHSTFQVVNPQEAQNTQTAQNAPQVQNGQDSQHEDSLIPVEASPFETPTATIAAETPAFFQTAQPELAVAVHEN